MSQSDIMKERWKDPKWRAMHAERNNRIWADPKYRKRMSDKAKTQLADPVQLAAFVAAARAVNVGSKHSAEHKADISKALKGKPKSAAHRASMKRAWAEGRRVVSQTAEGREKRSRRIKELWALGHYDKTSLLAPRRGPSLTGTHPERKVRTWLRENGIKFKEQERLVEYPLPSLGFRVIRSKGNR